MVPRRGSESDQPGGAPTFSTEDVPPSVVIRAKAALGRRGPGALAVLVADSTVDSLPSDGERTLRFEHPRGWVELVVAVTGERCAIRGSADPPLERAELEPEGGEVIIAHDVKNGMFVFAAVPRGILRVRLVGAPGAQPVHTDWVRV